MGGDEGIDQQGGGACRETLSARQHDLGLGDGGDDQGCRGRGPGAPIAHIGRASGQDEPGEQQQNQQTAPAKLPG